MTPLVVAETGARLAVVRGFVTDPAAPAPPPSGKVTVDGSLAPGESPAAAPTALPAWPQEARGSIDLSILVNRWPGDIYNAFVFAQTERAASGAAIAAAGRPATGAAARGDGRAEVAQRGIRAAVVGVRGLCRVHVVQDGAR